MAVKRMNLLPEDDRQKEFESGQVKKEAEKKSFEYHIPVEEKEVVFEKPVEYKQKVRDTVKMKPLAEIAEKKEEKPAVKIEEIAVIKKRKVIKERKQEEVKTKSLFAIIRKKEKEVVKKPGTLEVNLIPEEFLKLPVDVFRIKIYQLLKISFIFLLFVVAVFMGLFYYSTVLKKEIAGLDSRIASLDNEISQYSSVREQISVLEKRTSSLLNLLTKHIYWTKFFTYLEKNTIDNVYFLDFNATKDGLISMSGNAKDYKSVARQIVAFENADDFISSVIINSATAQMNESKQVSAVSFSAALVLTDNFLVQDDLTVGAQEEEAQPIVIVPSPSENNLPLENLETTQNLPLDLTETSSVTSSSVLSPPSE